MPRILLVEDSQTQAIRIRTKLVDEGYEVEVAVDGQAALDAIPRFWPHLILTDMEMPVLDGLELVVQSRAKYPTIPIILITAAGSDRTAVQALDRGAAAYLPKSMLDERLFATIEEILDVMEAGASYRNLIDSMDYNEFRFTLANDPQLVRPLVELVKQMALGVSLCDETECVRTGVAVDHALRNAMFHGNLELTREQLESDSELVVEGEPSLSQRRASQPKFADRRVHVTIQLTPSEATFVIRDDGNGFDSPTLLASPFPTPPNANVLEPENGRGLILIQSLMDEVRFNESGNEITMVKRKPSA